MVENDMMKKKKNGVRIVQSIGMTNMVHGTTTTTSRNEENSTRSSRSSRTPINDDEDDVEDLSASSSSWLRRRKQHNKDNAQSSRMRYGLEGENLISAFLEESNDRGEEDNEAVTQSIFWRKSSSPSSSTAYTSSNDRAAAAAAPTTSPRILGTFSGVFLPSTQNILGIILFLRVPWVVGQAGVLVTLCLVAFCVCITTLTALSLSALCTNGAIPAGGPYFVVSRNLGPGIGASIGLLFYFGTVFAGSMYALGAVEAFVTGFGIGKLFSFGTQLLGILAVITAGVVVRVGIGFVNRFGLVFFGAVAVCVLLLVVGAALFAADAFEPEGDVAHGSNLFPNFQEDPDLGVTPDIALLLSILFPGHTGIMAGCNRSGTLRNPSMSIPTGTLGAIGFTTLLFFVVVVLYGFTIGGDTLRTDKFVCATVAWPHSSIVVVGVVFASIGATLQCMVGSPQLLQAIADDELIPALSIFRGVENRYRAVYFTILLAALPCLAGTLDAVTPIVTMFFLVMYAAINASCFVLAHLREPGWRPSWKYFNRWSAACGFVLCAVLMFLISYVVAIATLIIAFGVYMYVVSQNVRKHWGDAMSGIRLSEARRTLLSLSKISTVHKKNWRPQVLVLCKIDAKRVAEGGGLSARTNALLSFAAQLKKGQGLVMVRSLVLGNPLDPEAKRVAHACDGAVRVATERAGIRGFARATMYSGSFEQAAVSTLQEAGLAALAPNCVVSLWPRWAANVRIEDNVETMNCDGAIDSDDEETKRQRCRPRRRTNATNVGSDVASRMESYVSVLKSAIALGKAVAVMKNPNLWPSTADRLRGTFDVWWLVHDGGLLLLTSHLLMRHKVWAGCKMRLFTLAKSTQEAASLTARIGNLLRELRLDSAELRVLCMSSENVDTLEYNRTVRQERAPSPMSTTTPKRSLPRMWTNPRDTNGAVSTAGGASDKIDVIVGGGANATPTQRDIRTLLKTNRNTTPAHLRRSQRSRRGSSEGCEKKDDKTVHASESEKFLRAAIELNILLQKHSGNAQSELVVINLPLTRKLEAAEFVRFTELLTKGMSRVLLMRGSGEEVVTALA